MLEPTTIFLWGQLLASQEQLSLACQNNSPFCAIDVSYQREWEQMRDYVDMAVSNIESDLEVIQSGGQPVFTEREIQAKIIAVIEQTTPTAGWLLNGYLCDLASCPEEDHGVCPLKQRAKLYLEYTKELGDEQVL